MGRDGPAVNQDPFGLANHPVVGVSWYEALAFTRWLTTRLRDREVIPKKWTVQLPNEPEWEKAARGTDGRLYPWGSEAKPNWANYKETGIGTTSTVGCFPQGKSHWPKKEGANHIEEMSGNVWEWTRSVYVRQSYPPDETKWATREQLNSKGLRVLRGGSWRYRVSYMRCAFRGWNRPGSRYYLLGFRVVASPLSSP